MIGRNSRLMGLGVGVVALGLLASSTALAQRTVRGQVLIVLAKEEAGEVDSALRNEPALRRPPFNSFRSMKVLDRPGVQLTVGRPAEVTLPNERKLRLELQQVMPDGRFRVKVSINKPGKNDYLPLLTVVASPGDPFFVAGQSHQGGTLVIGVRVGERPEGASIGPEKAPRKAE